MANSDYSSIGDHINWLYHDCGKLPQKNPSSEAVSAVDEKITLLYSQILQQIDRHREVKSFTQDERKKLNEVLEKVQTLSYTKKSHFFGLSNKTKNASVQQTLTSIAKKIEFVIGLGTPHNKISEHNDSQETNPLVEQAKSQSLQTQNQTTLDQVVAESIAYADIMLERAREQAKLENDQFSAAIAASLASHQKVQSEDEDLQKALEFSRQDAEQAKLENDQFSAAIAASLASHQEVRSEDEDLQQDAKQTQQAEQELRQTIEGSKTTANSPEDQDEGWLQFLANTLTNIYDITSFLFGDAGFDPDGEQDLPSETSVQSPSPSTPSVELSKRPTSSQANMSPVKNPSDLTSLIEKITQDYPLLDTSIEPPQFARSYQGGLPNVGNTCYLNSALQQIRCNPVLLEIIERTEVLPTRLNNGIAENHLIKVVQRIMLLQNTQHQVPEELMILCAKLLEIANPMYNYLSQHDTSEILTYLIGLATPSKSSTLDAMGIVSPITVSQTEARHLDPEDALYPPLQQFCKGESVEISNKPCVSTKLEIPTQLTTASFSLNQLLENYFDDESIEYFDLTDFFLANEITLPDPSQVETLTQEEIYQAPSPYVRLVNGSYYKVANKLRMSKLFHEDNLPKSLAINLTRKHYDSATETLSKSQAAIGLPQEISFPPAAIAYRSGITPKRYRLVSCTIHGGSATGGHYTAYIKNKENKWQYCNDSVCQNIAPNNSPNKDWTGAIYERIEE